MPSVPTQGVSCLSRFFSFISNRNTLLAIMLALLTCYSPPGLAARLALVIGNSEYPDQPLDNPVNDARAISEKLRNLKFEVTTKFQLGRDEIGLTIDQFLKRIGPGDTVVFFYAGHGVQVNGLNYLLATDAKINALTDVTRNGVDVSQFLNQLEATRAAVKIIFLDACRNNPFTRSFRGNSQSGLARVGGAASGTLISFATQPGGVAADGDGDHGLYTAQLLNHIDAPGVPVELMLKRVASDTHQASAGKQRPWIEGSILGDFVFNQAATNQAIKTTPVPSALASVESEAWEVASSGNSVELLQTFIKEFPDSPRASLARIKIARLNLERAASQAEPVSRASDSDSKESSNAPASPLAALSVGQRFRATHDQIDITVRWTGKALQIERFIAPAHNNKPASYTCARYFGGNTVPVDSSGGFDRLCNLITDPGEFRRRIVGKFPQFDVYVYGQLEARGLAFKPLK